MWELDHKEGWALKTWCFQTVVLEKTLESPLDCKEIQPVSQFSCSVMADSLWPHGLQHARPPCPSPTSRVYSNSRPLSRWCHPTISSSVVNSLLFLPSIFPSIRVFSNESALHIRWPKYWSLSISPCKSIQGWFILGLICLNSLLSKGLSRAFYSTTIWKHQFFSPQPYLWSNSHIRAWLLEKL